MQESFDPIIDTSTDTDLLPLMVQARQYFEWDYKNMHTLLLRHKVCEWVGAGVGGGGEG
jgi:hypothetical protein